MKVLRDISANAYACVRHLRRNTDELHMWRFKSHVLYLFTVQNLLQRVERFASIESLEFVVDKKSDLPIDEDHVREAVQQLVEGREKMKDWQGI